MNTIPEKRKKKLIIEKSFQYRFTLRICLIGGALLFMFGGMLLYIVHLNFETLIQNNLAISPPPVPAHELLRWERFLSLGLIGVLIAMVGILFALGLILTQRIAGPLLALQLRLQEYIDGKKGIRLRLRKDDEFKNLETVFNTAMEAHDAQVEKLEELSADLKSNNLEAARTKLAEILKN